MRPGYRRSVERTAFTGVRTGCVETGYSTGTVVIVAEAVTAVAKPSTDAVNVAA